MVPHDPEGRAVYSQDLFDEKIDLSSAQPERFERLLGLLLRECDGNLMNGMQQARFAFFNHKLIARPEVLSQ